MERFNFYERKKILGLSFDITISKDSAMDRLLNLEFQNCSPKDVIIICGSWAAPNTKKNPSKRDKFKSMRHQIGSAKQLLAKLKSSGFTILYCDEAYTSQRCPCCHNLGLKCLPNPNYGSKERSTSEKKFIKKKNTNSITTTGPKT